MVDIKVLGIIFLILFIASFLFAKIKINGRYDYSILDRVGACLVISFILTWILGLPILGILCLIR